jgi:hypothetical protein
MTTKHTPEQPTVHSIIGHYTPNHRQTLCFAINELEELVKSTHTDNNIKALELLNQALSLL